MTSRSRSRDRPIREDRRDDFDRDSRSRSRSHTPRGNDSRYRSRSRSYSRERSYDSRSRSRSRSGSPSQPAIRSTKIVVERLTKNVTEAHLREIFGQYGEIEDLDLPMNRVSGTNRGTAYILYVHEADAERAITSMHEAQVDGAVINVSIVLPRRKFSPPPPQARRGANFDPRAPPPNFRGPAPGGPFGGPASGADRGRRSPPPAAGSNRYGRGSDTYRPRSISRSRSRSRSPNLPGNANRRHRSRSRSYSSASRSRSRTAAAAAAAPAEAAIGTAVKSGCRICMERMGSGTRNYDRNIYSVCLTEFFWTVT
ncbi:hypothetical protein QBC37DRAFT_206399 [Rhypophila decipiens]|uniref:RRM domain-containing protein n=1 Tax=Rhypophila decipiens TaxID=261697 RepID=A0AAN6Y353_9PEZI|nr:hypothetical protein QBC37DRAFT_206399 [Rhypophila decipiens]